MNISLKTKWYSTENFLIIISLKSQHLLQISAHFEVSWSEIEFYLECLKFFSIFVSWWFFELLTNFSRLRRHSIYFNFFVCLKEHVDIPTITQTFLFWINLSSIRCKEIYATRTQFFGAFFEWCDVLFFFCT